MSGSLGGPGGRYRLLLDQEMVETNPRSAASERNKTGERVSMDNGGVSLKESHDTCEYLRQPLADKPNTLPAGAA